MPTPADVRRYSTDPMAFFDDAFRARGLAMAAFQRERFALLVPAIIALAAGRKPPIGRYWLEGVKGSSKDSDLAIVQLWLISFSKHPIDGQVGASDADQSVEMLKAVREWLQSMPWLSSRVKIQNWKLLCQSTDSTITYVASDAAGGAHGSRCLLYIINEISHISKVEFWQTLLDNSAKIPNGLVIVAGNAGFTDSAAFKLREIYRTSSRHKFHQFCGPVPWQDQQEIADAERRGPQSRFDRLFKGVWTTGSGDALRQEDIAASFAAGLPMLNSTPPGWTAIGGLDGAISKHFAAFVVLGKNQHGRYRVLKAWQWRPPAGGKIDQEQVQATIAAAWKDYRMVRIASDPAKVEYLIQLLQRAGVRIEERQQSGKNLVEQAFTLIDNFTSHNIECPAFDALEYDLRHLRVEERSYGMRLVSDEGPHGHGDLATALSIALAAGKTMPVASTEPLKFEGHFHMDRGARGPFVQSPVRSHWSY